MTAQDPAIIKANYADWKPVKTRSVLQIILEVPIENTKDVMDALGVPMPATEIPVAVALLNPEAEKPAPPMTGKDIVDERKRNAGRRFDEMSYAQQAGIMCSDRGFINWLGENTTADEHNRTVDCDWAAAEVRRRCEVESRADLNADDPYTGARWRTLLSKYRQDTGRTAEERG